MAHGRAKVSDQGGFWLQQDVDQLVKRVLWQGWIAHGDVLPIISNGSATSLWRSASSAQQSCTRKMMWLSLMGASRRSMACPIPAVAQFDFLCYGSWFALILQLW